MFPVKIWKTKERIRRAKMKIMKLGGLKTLKYRINYLHFVPMREMCNKEHNYNRKERERWKNIEKL